MEILQLQVLDFMKFIYKYVICPKLERIKEPGGLYLEIFTTMIKKIFKLFKIDKRWFQTFFLGSYFVNILPWFLETMNKNLLICLI